MDSHEIDTTAKSFQLTWFPRIWKLFILHCRKELCKVQTL